MGKIDKGWEREGNGGKVKGVRQLHTIMKAAVRAQTMDSVHYIRYMGHTQDCLHSHERSITRTPAYTPAYTHTHTLHSHLTLSYILQSYSHQSLSSLN